MFIEKIKRFIGIDNKLISLENKLFNVVCFAVSLSMLGGIIVNFSIGFPKELILVEIFLGICSALAFFISRYKGYTEKIALAYVCFGMIMFLPGWFLNGGVEGSSTQIGVFFIGLILLLIAPKYHFFFIFLLIAVFYGCYEVEKYFPNLVIHAKDNSQKQTDLIFSAMGNIFMVGLLISFLKRIHAKDKNELIKKSEELEKSRFALSLAKDKAILEMDAKSNFLARMSHEIRTPLNGVLGTTELLSETDLSSEQLQLIQMLQSSSNLLINIVSDILDLSKMEADMLTLNLADTNLRKCVENAIRISTPYVTFARKKIEINCTVDDDVAETLLMDENRVQQILINLISNAIKFTEEGSVSLHVFVNNKTENMQELVFSVIDTGIGIKGEAVSKLFLPFSQISNSFSEIFSGTGLGLSICKKLVDLMEGEIWVESQEMKGSNFSFKLPLKILELKDAEGLNIR